MNLVFDGHNFTEIQESLGKRPGGYRVDPFYLRRGLADKPYFWDHYRRKWEMIRLGDQFFNDEDGVPRKTGMRRNGSKDW